MIKYLIVSILFFQLITNSICSSQDTVNSYGSKIINQRVGRIDMANLTFYSSWYDKYTAGNSQIAKTYSDKQKKAQIREIDKKSKVGYISYMATSSCLDCINSKNYYAEIFSKDKLIQTVNFYDKMGECCSGAEFYNYLLIYLNDDIENEFRVIIYDKLSGNEVINAIIIPNGQIDYKSLYQQYRKDWPQD